MAIEVRDTTGVGTADEFASELVAKTGLAPDVVRAWMRAEGAYAKNGTGGFNYLNVRARGATGYSGVKLAAISSGGFAQFRTVDDAVKESAYFINRMPNFAGIRASVTKDEPAQLAAIAASLWDAGHYQGGSLLTGAWKVVKGFGTGVGEGGAGVLGGTLKAVTDPGAIVEGAERWLEAKAPLVLAYIGLTSASVTLFVLGLNKLSGGDLGSAAMLVASKGRATSKTRAAGGDGDIPF